MPHFARRKLGIVAGLLLIVPCALYSAAKIHISPKFTVGEIFRYQIDTQETSSGGVTTPIVNPSGGSQSSESTHLILRFKVLENQPESKSGFPAEVKLQTTYEESQASTTSDAQDATTSPLAAAYSELEGQSFELSVSSDGTSSSFGTTSEVLRKLSTDSPALSWTNIGGIFLRVFPPEGISIGQKWGMSRPLLGTVPLTGSEWQMSSTYLRGEPCMTPSDLSHQCAAILTRFQIVRRGSGDPTPPEYVKSGLRTSGTWTGSGESLDFISLATGRLVRSTQTSTQDLDYQVASASTGSSVHQVSHTSTRTEITLLSEP